MISWINRISQSAKKVWIKGEKEEEEVVEMNMKYIQEL